MAGWSCEGLDGNEKKFESGVVENEALIEGFERRGDSEISTRRSCRSAMLFL